MARGTRKSSKGKIITIPELRRGFEHIEEVARRLVAAIGAKKMTKSAAIAEYAKEWKKVFHRTLPSKSAEASIDFAMTVRPATRKSRGTMRGGAAPLDHGLQPGIYSAPTLPGQVDAGGYTLHAQVPNYVSSGLAFNGVTPTDSHQALCGKENTTPLIAADMGSNIIQKGGSQGLMHGDVSLPGSAGALFIKGGAAKTRKGLAFASRKSSRKQRGGAATLAAAFRPLSAENPTTVGNDIQTAWKGMPLPASPSPADPAWSYQAANMKAPDFSGLEAIDRVMTSDVSSGSK
jgi:hypothetical protein